MTFNNFSIKKISSSDTKRLLNLINRNRGRLEKYFPITVSEIKDESTTKRYISKKLKQAREGELYAFLVEEKSDCQAVAYFIIKNINWYIPKCELAYMVDGNWEGRGITSKGIGQIVKHCFEELEMNKVFIRTGLDNFGSKKVALKNDFKLEGIIRNDHKTTDGTVVDIEYYGITKADYSNSSNLR